VRLTGEVCKIRTEEIAKEVLFRQLSSSLGQLLTAEEKLCNHGTTPGIFGWSIYRTKKCSGMNFQVFVIETFKGKAVATKTSSMDNRSKRRRFVATTAFSRAS